MAKSSSSTLVRLSVAEVLTILVVEEIETIRFSSDEDKVRLSLVSDSMVPTQPLMGDFWVVRRSAELLETAWSIRFLMFSLTISGSISEPGVAS